MKSQAAVDLGLEEKCRVDNGLGLGGGQLVDQPGMTSRGHGQRPMLAMLWSSMAMTATGQMAAVAAGAGEVVKAALQTEKVGRLVHSHHATTTRTPTNQSVRQTDFRFADDEVATTALCL
jgi:hypothetical protein